MRLTNNIMATPLQKSVPARREKNGMDRLAKFTLTASYTADLRGLVNKIGEDAGS